MDSLNNCWVCSFKNISTATVCANTCPAVQTPTRDPIFGPLNYQVLSFGQRADQLSCERLHVQWLDEAIHTLQRSTLVAVRVGVGSNTAIIINDANNRIHKTMLLTPGMRSSLPQPTGNDATDFLQAARIILGTDPDPDAGKIKLSTTEPSLTVHPGSQLFPV